MKPDFRIATTALLTTVLALASACGDDDTGTSGGSDGTAGSTGATAGSTGATVGTTDGTSVGTASASGGSTSMGSSGGTAGTTGGVTEVLLYGDVRDYISDQPIPGVDIYAFDDPNLSTTADDMGIYQLGPFAPNTDHFIVLPDDMDYWGAIIPVSIGNEAMQQQPLSKISRSFVQSQQDLLMDQMPAPHDPTTAFLLVRVLQNSAIMEGNVTIELSPPPAPDTYYAPDPDGKPILNSNEAQWGLLPVVVYFNVEPMAPGSYTITATHPVRDCTVKYPDFPTVGAHMTLVDVDCPPPG